MKDLSEQELIELTKQKNGEALVELFRRNLPMIQHAMRRYYIRQYDATDWQQDALYICYESACLFRPELNVKFSGFFQLRFLNHAKSLVRFELAQKREPYSKALSYSQNAIDEYSDEKTYESFISESSLNLRDWEDCVSRLSYMELIAFQNHLGNLTEEECIDQLHCNKIQFVAAKHRCQRKIKKYLWLLGAPNFFYATPEKRDYNKDVNKFRRYSKWQVM